MTTHLLAGKPVPASLLVDVPALVTAYFALHPDPEAPEQRVAFGQELEDRSLERIEPGARERRHQRRRVVGPGQGLLDDREDLGHAPALRIR